MNFDTLAPHYRWMEFVLAGNKLQRCRTAFLAKAADRQNVLLMGEGNGRFLVECRRQLKVARITCVDASGQMLALARKQLQSRGLSLEQIEFVQADALEWTPPKRAFDLVVTHFFLDCFKAEQLRPVVASLADAATADAVWLLADFQVPPGGLRRHRAKTIHRAMYLFFSLATRLPARTLTVPDSLLEAMGFVLCERQVTDWGLLHTDRWVRVRR